MFLIYIYNINRRINFTIFIFLSNCLLEFNHFLKDNSYFVILLLNNCLFKCIMKIQI